MIEKATRKGGFFECKMQNAKLCFDVIARPKNNTSLRGP